MTFLYNNSLDITARAIISSKEFIEKDTGALNAAKPVKVIP